MKLHGIFSIYLLFSTGVCMEPSPFVGLSVLEETRVMVGRCMRGRISRLERLGSLSSSLGPKIGLNILISLLEIVLELFFACV